MNAPTLASVRELIEQLAAVRLQTFVPLFRCKRCGADDGSPCTRPNGTPLPLNDVGDLDWHAPRADLAGWHYNYCPTYLRFELKLHERGDTSPAFTPAHVLKQLTRSRLYKALRKAGLVGTGRP